MTENHFWINWLARMKMGYALSAAADFVLAIAAFDLGAIAAHDVFEQAMTSTLFQKEFVELFLIFAVVTLLAWSQGVSAFGRQIGKNF